MCGQAARVVLNEPPTWTARCRARLSASASGKPAHLMMPALLIRMSMRPKCSTAASTSACAPAGVATSLVSAIAAPPAATISAATGRRRFGVRALALHRAAEVVDDDAGAPVGEESAWARPMPRPAPVTTATRPSKLCSSTRTPFQPDGVYRPVTIASGSCRDVERSRVRRPVLVLRAYRRHHAQPARGAQRGRPRDGARPRGRGRSARGRSRRVGRRPVPRTPRSRRTPSSARAPTSR